jgi:hypothetical protein
MTISLGVGGGLCYFGDKFQLAPMYYCGLPLVVVPLILYSAFILIVFAEVCVLESIRTIKWRRLKKKAWDVGDVFIVKNADGKFSIGQVLSKKKIEKFFEAICFFADKRVNSIEEVEDVSLFFFSAFNLFAIPLDTGEWPVVGHKPVTLQLTDASVTRIMLATGKQPYVEEFLNLYWQTGPTDEFRKRFSPYLLKPENGVTVPESAP